MNKYQYSNTELMLQATLKLEEIGTEPVAGVDKAEYYQLVSS